MRIHQTAAAEPNGPLTWFAELWLARQSGDENRERAARLQLRQRGVDVLIDDGVAGLARSIVQAPRCRQGGAA